MLAGRSFWSGAVADTGTLLAHCFMHELGMARRLACLGVTGKLIL
jgi:hypothetical protein